MCKLCEVMIEEVKSHNYDKLLVGGDVAGGYMEILCSGCGAVCESLTHSKVRSRALDNTAWLCPPCELNVHKNIICFVLGEIERMGIFVEKKPPSTNRGVTLQTDGETWL